MLRWAIVGGGGTAKIGPVHLQAAARNGQFELVAAAPSSRPEVAAATDWGCTTTGDWTTLLTAGLDAVSIVTPNHLHMPMAKAFDAAGVAVICDKPLANATAEVDGWRPQMPFIVTYNYSAYPAIRRARKLVADGALGDVTLVRMGWAQDGRLKPGGESGWRADPARAGAGGTLADLGTHCIHLAEFILQDRVSALNAEIEPSASALPRHAEMLWRFAGGARGSLWVSQIVPGGGKGLELLIAGTRRSLRWRLDAPDDLLELEIADLPAMPATVSPDIWLDRHIDAFSALYGEAARAIRGEANLAPDYADGVRGMRFIDAALRSGGHWTIV